MGLFSRFTDIVNANLNSMLDKAEQPEKMIKLIIGEMEETLIEVRTTAAKNIAEKKTLARQMQSTESDIESWHEKAELALAKNRDDLAKSALAQKHKLQAELTELNASDEQLSEFLNAVQDDALRLQEKLHEARKRQEVLLRREESAVVRLKIREKSAVHNIDEAIGRFERYQQKIDNIEAQVEAYDFTADKSLSAQINELEQDDNIAQELAAMKKKAVNA